MITGEIRSKADKIWTDIWAGGVTNLTAEVKKRTAFPQFGRDKAASSQTRQQT